MRKLQVTMDQAVADGADTVVTTGAPQSNHARLTAAAGARLGLRVVLVLEGHEPERDRGKILLGRLFGAEIVWAGARTAAEMADEVGADPARGRVYRIPFGGSSPASAEVYVRAGAETLSQVRDLQHLVVAVGSGGTMAGLVVALRAERVLGMDSGAVPDATATVHGLLSARRSGTEPSAGSLRIDREQVGEGYEQLAPRAAAALSLAARTEGLVLPHLLRSGHGRPGGRRRVRGDQAWRADRFPAHRRPGRAVRSRGLVTLPHWRLASSGIAFPCGGDAAVVRS